MPFRDIVETYAAALREGRRDEIKRMLATDIVSYDATPPLENVGEAAVVKRLDAWMDLYPEGMHCDIHFGGAAASGDVGFCWFLERIAGRRADGLDIDMWVRVTWCLRRLQGDWRIVHGHQSDPFDGKTLQARIDLKPAS